MRLVDLPDEVLQTIHKEAQKKGEPTHDLWCQLSIYEHRVRQKVVTQVILSRLQMSELEWQRVEGQLSSKLCSVFTRVEACGARTVQFIGLGVLLTQYLLRGPVINFLFYKKMNVEHITALTSNVYMEDALRQFPENWFERQEYNREARDEGRRWYESTGNLDVELVTQSDPRLQDTWQRYKMMKSQLTHVRRMVHRTLSVEDEADDLRNMTDEERANARMRAEERGPMWAADWALRFNFEWNDNVQHRSSERIRGYEKDGFPLHPRYKSIVEEYDDYWDNKVYPAELGA